MINVRSAKPEDQAGIIRVLDEADLRYTTETMKGFTVAEIDHEIVGIVRLEDHPAFYFLTSLGVRSAWKKQGIASTLLQAVLKGKSKPVYLYTIIPDFFLPFGFTATTPVPSLPAKEIYGCELCSPGKCVTMVRMPINSPKLRRSAGE